MNKENKKFETYIAQKDDTIFKIVEDLPGVGWYLFMYEDGKDIYDTLQDTLKKCQEFALKEFDVPLTSWEKQ